MLTRGTIPWSNKAELASFVGSMTGLTRTDAVPLSVAELIRDYLDATPDLKVKVDHTPDPARAVRVLLGDNALRTHAEEVVKVVTASSGGRLS